MKLETAKSLLLIILIGTSLVLTFGMWNYRAEYDPINENGSVDREDLGGTEKEVSDIIKPIDIIFKESGDYFSYKNPENTAGLYESIQQWMITDLQVGSVDDTEEVNQEVEVIFPNTVPLSILEEALNFEETLSSMANFPVNRFVIDFEEDVRQLRIQFISENNEAVEGVIHTAASYDDLLNRFKQLETEDFEELELITDTARDIYLPVKTKTISSYQYTFNEISSGKIRNVLFPNLNVVSVSESSGNIMYRTDNSQLRIAGYGMRYINVSESMESIETNVLYESMKDINEYSGFTGDFRLDNLTEDSVTYRLYHFNYPVMNTSYTDLATIYQEWNNQRNQLSEYNRSLIHLHTQVNSSAKKLWSSKEVIQSIENNENINMENIEDIRIGYRLTIESDDNNDDYVSLEPAWYYRINHNWSTVPNQHLDKSNNLDASTIEGRN